MRMTTDHHEDLGEHHDHDLIDFSTAIDEIEPELEADAGEIDLDGIGRIPADALRIFVQMLLPSGKPTSPSFWKTTTVRLAALAHGIGVDPVAGHSLTAIATGIGCTRAIISIYSTRLRDAGHLGHRSGKSNHARAIYSERAKAVWAQRHNSADESSKRLQSGKESKAAASPRNCANATIPARSLLP